MKKTAIALALLAACACGQKPYIRSGQTVTIPVSEGSENGPKTIRLTVVDRDILRIQSSPQAGIGDRHFSLPGNVRGSLSVLKSSGRRVPFKVRSEGGKLTLGTAAFTAETDTRTGRITLRKADGSLVLEENGTLFRGKGYTQSFRSPDGESLFGLGQHQGGVMDYKGEVEELCQTNTRISVPFLISNRGYGIFADNYSYCRFGSEQGEMPLGRLFTLYDKDGKKGALTGTYMKGDVNPPTGGQEAEGSVGAKDRDGHRQGAGKIVRREEGLPFGDIFSVERLPEGFPLDGAEVLYEGWLEAPQDGEYRFSLTYSGFVSLFLDVEKAFGTEVWRPTFNPNTRVFRVRMEKGRRILLRLEWRPDGKRSFCSLGAYPPADDPEEWTWTCESGPGRDEYVFFGDKPDEVIGAFRRLTGKAALLPKWAFGYWQSRDRYRTQEELLGVLGEFRARHLPLDNIVLDWNHWKRDSWGSHEFEAARFPDPKGMVDTVHARDARIMVSVWPKFYEGTEHYDEFMRLGRLYQGSVRDSLKDWLGYRYAFYDAYAADARRLFWNQVEEHYGPLGMDAWWADATEPNVLANVPAGYRKALCGPTALGPSEEFFNAYALMHARGIHEGESKSRPGHRPFLLTRSAFAGLQRYSASAWSGDIGSRWEEMEAQIAAGLSFSLTGMPWWTMDIGGYSPERRYVQAVKDFGRTGEEKEDLREWRELNARWFQFGAFTPLFRSHGQFPFREPWEIAPEGHPAYESIRHSLELRYRLLPYIYACAGQVWKDDATLMRALVFDFPEDPESCRTADQYLFGPSIMVAPVCRYGARQRSVYFPAAEGGWYGYDDGSRITQEGKLTVPAPYGRIPIYVRAGSIIPEGPAMEWTGQDDGSHLTLKVYPGADGAFLLYEDAGTDNDYLKGKWSAIPLSYDDGSRTLHIGARKGRWKGMPGRRTFTVETPDGIRTEVAYDGSPVQVSLSSAR